VTELCSDGANADDASARHADDAGRDGQGYSQAREFSFDRTRPEVIRRGRRSRGSGEQDRVRPTSRTVSTSESVNT